MSDEDVEFRESLVQCLESKGILNKVKAELRTNVFLALELQEVGKGHISLASPKIASFIQTQEGELIIGLVREFLEFFELEYTASVFEPECNLELSYIPRDKLCEELKLDSEQTGIPLLSQMIWSSSSGTSVELQPPPNINEYSMHTSGILTVPPVSTIAQPTQEVRTSHIELQRQDLSHHSTSISGTAEVVSEDEMTNDYSDILVPADSISDKNSQSDLLLDEYLNSKPLENLFLNVKDLIPSPEVDTLTNKAVLLPTSASSHSERPRTARGGQRSPQTVSLIDAPPLGLEFEMKSVQSATPYNDEELMNKHLYSDFLSKIDYPDDFVTSKHSYSEYSELKLNEALDSTPLNVPNETSEHTISAVSLVEFDFEKDIIH